MQEVREINFIEFSDIYNQYLLEDFPEDEVKPLYVIENAFAANKYTAYVLEEDSQVKAYATFMWKEKDLLLLDYFAVTREAGRGGGIGSVFLQELARNIKAKGFIIECEAPEKAINEEDKVIREKRIAFYERNGVEMTTVIAEVVEVDFCLLYMPIEAGIESIDMETDFLSIYHNLEPKDFYQKFVKIIS
ncbi:GNAT family N-acetyltransferase [Elizabethkingia bruuniana]|uniref:GNAT family N-acetyltransferase n=1 Tax=Elizabethkingia bruuniana TaxID=1756149 RepID=A0A7T7ZWF2_9FLAO|nr:GNAT family N-acetyltransferase [Elizabethkingia bruuniana]KGO10191.1 acetyltransferase [Elizabethkingia miricola]AQX84116.1 acetyltransferase [Elizabethkingia bruuniana]KUY28293.1 acetyltransferase [Elizabethkingia bruuniana]OPB64534.1 acetyltransferase [Elizabethkingia bruuniana]QDZ63165.1 N-acetyltransferase [Elizabethkingia bruuniana]